MSYLESWRHYAALKAAGPGKLRTVLHPKQPAQPFYSDLFEYANKNITNPHDVAMVCNADIYLSDDFALPAHGATCALTRWEAKDVSPLIENYQGSHDAFLFHPPLPQSFLDAVRHPQNAYKSENIVLHELQKIRVVKNPCRTVRVYHKHDADFRQWLPSVDEERYARCPPE